MAMLAFAFCCLISPLSQARESVGSEAEAAAQTPAEGKEPVYIEADSMHFDQTSQIASAVGNVVIVQGKRVLRADRVAYHEPSGAVRASGNVSMLEPDGNVFFAEHVELRDGLKRGIIHQLRARFIDNSMMAANEGEKVSDSVTKLKKAVYSPCKICTDATTGEEESPLWQLKASSVTKDDEEQRITYRNARMEVLGVPIFYTPYLSHPSPDSGSKSGILAPSYKVSSQLGTMISVPYYWSIAPNMDATITPTTASNESPILGGEFRHMTDMGRYELRGSITNPVRRDDISGQVLPGHELRGHIEGTGDFRFNDVWKTGFNARYTSDDTYLRRYEISYDPLLTSNAWLEGIGDGQYDESYARAELLAFQDFRTGSVDTAVPVIHPLIQGEHVVPLSFLDSTLRLEGNILSLSRRDGNDTNRISGTAGWEKSFITDSGNRFDAKASVRADGYYTPELSVNGGPREDQANGRVVPKASLMWRYPLLASAGDVTTLIEPIVDVVAMPSGVNPEDIPNEDGLLPELSDTTIFSDERSRGYDRIESGSRVTYGFRTATNIVNDWDIETSAGQSYLVEPDPFFYYSTGPTEHWSDYTGRVSLRNSMVGVTYGFRMDKDDLKLTRNEVLLDFNWKGLSAHLAYNDFIENPLFGESEEIYGNVSWKFADEWRFFANSYRDLDDERWVANGLGLAYQNECVTVIGQASRIYARDRDLEPSTSYTVKLFLKNLN
ncbi:LPS assembly protein LptD [bacterium]|nr:LPS assembly protein LptD [bacterium]